jgi:hypothetical protein
MEMVTLNQCGELVRLVWLNGALVRLSELQESLEKQKASRTTGREEHACMGRNPASAASNAALYPQIAIDSVPTSK